MPGHPWFETLRRDLVRQRLPAHAINRYLRELADHAEDHATSTGAVQAESGLTELLGERHLLVEQATQEYRLATFSGRHPILTFVLAPIPVAFGAWMAYFLVVGLVFLGVGYLVYGPAVWHAFESMEYWSTLAWITLMAVIMLGAVAPPLATLLWYSRLARRCGRSWRWLVIPCLLLAWCAASYTWHMEVPEHLLIGWVIGESPTALNAVWQGGVLLLVGGLLVWRAARNQRFGMTPRVI